MSGLPFRQRSAMTAAAVLLLCSACAGLVRPPQASAETAPLPAWELPDEVEGTQRLYRVRYEGPEGKLSFKLTVYVGTADRFHMQAADVLGRQLWSLAVSREGQALWLNHRDKTYCYTDPRSGLVFIPLTRLPLEAVPRLLVGRLPEKPFADLRQAPGQVSFRDVLGRQWTAALDGDGAPLRWSLLEGGEPVAWWQRDPSSQDVLFSDRRGRQQVRWREIVHESLTRPLERTSVPEGYREERCSP